MHEGVQSKFKGRIMEIDKKIGEASSPIVSFEVGDVIWWDNWCDFFVPIPFRTNWV